MPGRGSVRAGSLSVKVETVSGRPAMVLRSDPGRLRGALTERDGLLLESAARTALEERIPILFVMSSSGASVHEGVAPLHAWGRAARALCCCSGVVPVTAAVTGPAISGPALLLGVADIVAMSQESFAYLSGPLAVAEVTGREVSAGVLGGAGVHGRESGIADLEASDESEAFSMVEEVLSYLPSHADEAPPRSPVTDPPDRLVPELEGALPPSERGSYDVRSVIAAVVDHEEMLELRPRFAPQLVTALARVAGQPVGIVANQPQVLAGTLDIAASQKGARFVSFCDSFNLPLLTFVDTPGFLPGKDLEWRGMIRHGAELAYAYANATVPRICLILRKAYGGAYIVMDSKGMGGDLTLAWPSAEVAVMGAHAAVQVLHRRAGERERAEAEEDYREIYLAPWIAAERGLVDDVIEPAETRRALSYGLQTLATKREKLRQRKHGNCPL